MDVRLKRAYERSGRDGLIALIQERTADSSFADNVYILADPFLVTLAGNLKTWPSTATAAEGWIEFRAPEPFPNATTRPLLRAQALPVKLVFPLVVCFLPGIFVSTLAPVLFQMVEVANGVLRSSGR